MRPGEELILRETEERVRVIAVIDASGTLLVASDGDAFQVSRDDVEWPWARHAGCGCCSS